MDTANPQGGGRRVRTSPSKRLQREEDAMLIAAGFKSVDRMSGLVWVKGDGVCYGREAALQSVEQKQREGGV